VRLRPSGDWRVVFNSDGASRYERFFIKWNRMNGHLQNREGAIHSATPELLQLLTPYS